MVGLLIMFCTSFWAEERTDVGPSVGMGGTEGGRDDAEAEAEVVEAEEKPVPVMVENFVRAVLVPQFGASFTHQSKDVIRSWDLVAKMQVRKGGGVCVLAAGIVL